MRRGFLYVFGLFFAAYPFLEERVAVACLSGVAAFGAIDAVFRRREFRVSLVDALALLAAAWVGISYFSNSFGLVQPHRIYEFIALCLVWLAVRNSAENTVLMWFIVAAGLIQSVLCGLQMADVTASNHSFFPFTGRFFNPGPLAGFLACSLSACAFLWRGARNIYLKIILVFTAAASMFFIIYSGSRAAWIAVLVGSAVCFGPLLRQLSMVRIAILSAVAVAACTGFYLLKPQSANGRLLIWKASAGMVADAPIAGHGAGAFEREYMYYQADYLQDKLASDEAMLADNVIFAFNEPVKILCEYGIIGLLIFGAFTASVFVAGCRRERVILAGFAAWIAFGMFSYPSDIASMRLLFVVLAAMLAQNSRTIFTMKNNFTTKIAAIIFAIFLAAAATINYLNPPKNNDPDSLYSEADKLVRAEKWSDALPILERAAAVAPSIQLTVDLGNCYARLNQLQEAEKTLKTAVNMAPGHARAAFELFDFYRRNDRDIEAKQWAQYIVARKFKTTNSLSLAAKKEARNYLASSEK